MNISNLYFLLFSIEYQSVLNLTNKLQLNKISPLRVTTRHYEPFMYQNDNGLFYHGIEFFLMQTIAKKLKTEVTYVNSSKQLSDTTTR